MKNLILVSLIVGCTNLATAQEIPMTFHNGSLRYIYLSIPGVMNPNLIPKSNSGVRLEVGQKVYFFPNGKKKGKELLFTVDASWRRDTILQIDEIVDARKKDLTAKRAPSKRKKSIRISF